MKLFAKLMIAVLFIALLLPFTILKDDKGDTLISFSDLKWPEFLLPGLGDSGEFGNPIEGLDGRVVFYQWYDAEANVQFTTEPPPDGVEYTVKEYDPNTNVIQAVKLPGSERENGDDKGSSAPAASAQSQEIGNPYDPEAIRKLFEDSKNIEKMLKQRLQRQEALLN